MYNALISFHLNNAVSSLIAEEAPVRVDPSTKTKVVRNPRLTLNPARLTGPRGIKTIEDVFRDFKFSGIPNCTLCTKYARRNVSSLVFLGKGCEREDLAMVMKKLEHWAHRLYPKFQFDDCLDKIAALGKKKEVSVCYFQNYLFLYYLFTFSRIIVSYFLDTHKENKTRYVMYGN